MPTQNIYDLVDTWNAGATTFTAVKMNVTDTASAAGSLLIDLQTNTGGAATSRFKVGKGAVGVYFAKTTDVLPSFGGTNNSTTLVMGTGGSFLVSQQNASMGVVTPGGNFAVFESNGLSVVEIGTSGLVFGSDRDAVLSRRGIRNLRLGFADTATPLPQTLSVQSATATGADVAGANFTITGSQGRGGGAGGSIIFQVAPAGTPGSGAVNALATALTINSNRSVNFQGPLFDSTNNLTFGSANANVVAAVTTSSSTGNPSSLALANSYALAWGATSNPLGALDVLLYRDNSGTLALRNGANAQTFRVYNTTDGTNSEFGKIAWSSNVLQIGTEKAGTGTGRNVAFQVDGTTRMTLFSGALGLGTGVYLGFNLGSGIAQGTADGDIKLRNNSDNGFGLLQFGGTNSSFPALKRSTTVLQARLADDSAFATIQGKLRADVNAVAETPTATHTITITDAAGTAYKVLCVAA